MTVLPTVGTGHPIQPSDALPFKRAAVEVTNRPDGSVLVRSPYRPGPAPASIAHLFTERAAEHPGRAMLARRSPDHGRWEYLTYGEALERARSVGQALLDLGMDAVNGVVILSDNSFEHAILMLGCYLTGVPSTAISTGFSLLSTDHAKLRHCVGLLRPRLVFAQTAAPFADAFATVRTLDPSIITVSVGPGADHAFGSLEAVRPRADLDRAFGALSHATVAKYLFTSGSTGLPKAVPQTHGMMAAMIGSRIGLLKVPEERLPPAVLDWMPWSHLSAGNIAFNHNLWTGGTLYIDDGRPTPALFPLTLKNFVELSPMTFVSAPIAFDMAAGALEANPEYREPFFRNLRWMAYGGASLSASTHDRLQALAIEQRGTPVPILTTYGATETQGITTVHWDAGRAGLVGLPLPGVTLKLTPFGDKLELRVRGKTIMSGYYGAGPDGADPFDEEGFYKIGDAVRFLDPAHPEQGLVFDGRTGEDFKLATGTWVAVGNLRLDLVAASACIRDVVITGHDRSYLGALIWVTAGRDAEAVASLADALRRFNAQAGGSSRRIARFLVLDEPPSLAEGEINDKGYVNQRRVLARRHEEVARLYADPVASGVTVLDAGRA
ncbi:MAG TPA: AMP-binding protein [Sphingomonas sp.]